MLYGKLQSEHMHFFQTQEGDDANALCQKKFSFYCSRVQIYMLYTRTDQEKDFGEEKEREF